MVSWILKKILGSKNQREIKRLQPLVRSINAFDEQFRALSDDELRAKTKAWNAELSAIDDPDALVRRQEEILPEAFAVVKNAARRMTERQQEFMVCDQPMTWNMVHFDVQLIGGIVLHRGGSRKWPRAKARRWSRPCRSISMRSPVAVRIW